MILFEREKLLSQLEQKIGYSFRSRALLDRALTHRSFANERVGENCLHNESMEFLGDSVLGFVVSAWLLERFPELAEGKLSKMKAFLVSETSLVELAGALDLGSYILLNRGEEKTGGRRKHALLADAYEALIGVLYIDGGIAVAEKFLRRELRQKLHGIDPSSMIGADYKSALQERLQGAGVPAPEYAVVEVTGPDHRRSFRVELRVGGRAIATGEGNTIKLAQQEAARNAIESDGDLIASAIEQRRAARSADQTANAGASSANRVDPELIEEQLSAPSRDDPDEQDSIPLARSVQAAGASESGDEMRAESQDEAFAREASLALRAESE